MLVIKKTIVVLAFLAFSTPAAGAVALLDPILFADFPIELHNPNGLLLEVPLVETKRFSEWNYQSGLRPRFYEVVAVVEVAEQIEESTLHITAKVHRRIASFDEIEAKLGSPTGTWESDPMLTLDKTITLTPSERIGVVRFGKKDVQDIWLALWSENLWPTEVRVQLELTCDTCDLIQRSTTIPFIPGD